MILKSEIINPRFKTLGEAEQYRISTDFTLAIYRLRIFGDPITWEFGVSFYPPIDMHPDITIDLVIRYDLFNRPLEYNGWNSRDDNRNGKKRETDCNSDLCWNDSKCYVCKNPICLYDKQLTWLLNGELGHLFENNDGD